MKIEFNEEAAYSIAVAVIAICATLVIIFG